MNLKNKRYFYQKRPANRLERLPKTSESLKTCSGAEDEYTGNRKPGNESEENIRKLEEELYTVKMERDILVSIFSQPQK